MSVETTERPYVVTVDPRHEPAELGGREFYTVSVWDRATDTIISQQSFWVDAAAEEHAARLRGSDDADPAEPVLYGIYDTVDEEFVDAKTSQREAEDEARRLSDDALNSFTRGRWDVDRYVVDHLPRPYPAWAVTS